MSHIYNIQVTPNVTQVNVQVSGARGPAGPGGGALAIDNNLSSTATDRALSANQGRILQEQIDSARQDYGDHDVNLLNLLETTLT